MKTKKAFTLIELLVVIAIIALLLSIIVPSLQKAKEAAQVITCKANLKNYGTAVTQYLGDNDGKFPDPRDWLANQQGLLDRGIPANCLWHAQVDASGNRIDPGGVLWPYLSHKDVHLCATMKIITRRTADGHEASGSHEPSIPIIPRFSYSMNTFLGQEGFYDGIIKQSEVGRVSSEVGVFTEESPYPIKINETSSYGGLNDNFFFSKWDLIASYHRIKAGDDQSGLGNVVFLDGHVGTHHWKESFHLFWPHVKERTFDVPWLDELGL